MAAAEPVGDPVLLWRGRRAFRDWGRGRGAATAVGLIEFGPRVRFHHPLALTAVAVQPSFSWESASMGKHEVILRQPAEGDRQCLI